MACAGRRRLLRGARRPSIWRRLKSSTGMVWATRPFPGECDSSSCGVLCLTMSPAHGSKGDGFCGISSQAVYQLKSYIKRSKWTMRRRRQLGRKSIGAHIAPESFGSVYTCPPIIFLAYPAFCLNDLLLSVFYKWLKDVSNALHQSITKPLCLKHYNRRHALQF